MDYTKWKSVAVRKDKYDIIKALCDKKYRAPAAFIAKLVDEYITFQASLMTYRREYLCNCI